jgi:hypothetical protein
MSRRATFLPDLLEGAREHGRDRWTARCPAHKDRSPSLSVTLTPDGMWLIHCFAGCGVDEILTALGLKVGDLFPDSEPEHRAPGPLKLSLGQMMRLHEAETQLVYTAACQVKGGTPLNGPDHRRLEQAIERIRAIYDYGRA